jgi:hypothetical protein
MEEDVTHAQESVDAGGSRERCATVAAGWEEEREDGKKERGAPILDAMESSRRTRERGHTI